jgi:hypothetical protein
MDMLRIRGGATLKGTIPVSGAKNSVLKLMCASLLTDQPVTLSNVPDLEDVRTLAQLLGELGTKISLDGDASAKLGPFGQVLTMHTPTVTNPRADYELVRKMRASITTLGPLVARHGYAEVSLPGGCAIGTRPVDLHIMALEQLGAEITIDNGYILARAPKGGLQGNTIVFPKVTVGGTECALLAATLAKGETIISNAAREPEIRDLCELLNKMGAKITGLDSDTLKIVGRRETERRDTYHCFRPHRNGYLCDCRRDHGRRFAAEEWPRRTSARLCRQIAGSRCQDRTTGRRHPRLARCAKGQSRRCDDRTLPGPCYRPAIAVDGTDVHRRWRVDDHRDDLREPLHACAGTGAHGCEHHRAGQFSFGPRRRETEGRQSRRPWRTDLRASIAYGASSLELPTAKPPSRAFTIWTAAMSAWKKNSAPSAPRSSASPIRMANRRRNKP